MMGILRSLSRVTKPYLLSSSIRFSGGGGLRRSRETERGRGASGNSKPGFAPSTSLRQEASAGPPSPLKRWRMAYSSVRTVLTKESDLMQLKDKIIVITGAASGIGRAMAVRF